MRPAFVKKQINSFVAEVVPPKALESSSACVGGSNEAIEEVVLFDDLETTSVAAVPVSVGCRWL